MLVFVSFAPSNGETNEFFVVVTGENGETNEFFVVKKTLEAKKC